jgi:hypothetical protein
MIRLDHLAIPVRDHARSREWYTSNFGFQIEIEIPERKTVGLRDDGDFTLFLEERTGVEVVPSCTLALQVDDVESKYRTPTATSSTSGIRAPCARRGEADPPKTG